MNLSENIIKEILPGGAISTISWKDKQLKRMLLPEKSILKIPNRIWDQLVFPTEIIEDTIHNSAARITFFIFVPPYVDSLNQEIASRLQEQVYDTSVDANLHQKSALNTLIRVVSKKNPQLLLAGDIITISSYERDYAKAIRFTSWSAIPAQLLQIRIIWSEAAFDEQKLIEVEVSLLFDQQRISPENFFQINRKGRLFFDVRRWRMDFDLDRIRSSELPEMDKLRTPEKIEDISSGDSSTEKKDDPRNELFQPRKRIRLENRFAISSSEDDS